ncbi:ribonuclease D [Longispora fulva]|uniref:Ribonuclease D n=1 Tax=Longispora fulva TaxID=619741 RepID=A0A8J7KH26_9ACTN|nr:ribonuclease D [Longispora fulva]MBG6138000.1 ribonuclease D [Longispora fulva]GIG60253.1 ribonuclease D [Longispora fulva]
MADDRPSPTYPHDAEPPQHTALLTEPRDGTPAPIVDTDGLREYSQLLSSGTGPIAVDAERASGYRYGQRAYLIQLRRVGAGTALVDPVPVEDFSPLAEALTGPEWVLHAASQDLPCLAELELRPTKLFDTELGARLAGFERVGLAALTESLLGFTLEKHHSAADWSSRPLPENWLTYAALDVELLIELRYAIATELERQGKLGWAEEEFAALVNAAPPAPRVDPWRRTSGMHKVRGARALARVRALWNVRDGLAAKRDTAPGRILPDTAIVAAAQGDPKDEAELFLLPMFGGRSTRRLSKLWLDALAEVRELTDKDLPTSSAPSDAPPPPHRWAEKEPEAAGRLARAREAVTTLAAEYGLPQENLLTPDTVRRLCWAPPEDADVAGFLRRHGAREWQISITAGALENALSEPAPATPSEDDPAAPAGS